MVFLSGPDSCSGSVGIEHGSKTYWLSGSNETWNKNTADVVCRQMHCGSASSVFSSINTDVAKEVWDKSLKCSSKAESLFECEAGAAPPGANGSVASVKCSGKET